MRITVLMGGTSSERDVSLASGLRIADALRWPVMLDGREVFVSASIGIAVSARGIDFTKPAGGARSSATTGGAP